MRLDDVSGLVDQVRNPLRVLVAGGIGGAIGDPDAAVGIAQQRKREVELLCESGVVGDVVETRAEDGRVLLFVLVDEVPEPGTLSRSTRGVGLWVEPQDDFAATEIVERNCVSLVILDLKIRSFVAYLQHSSSSQ